MDLEKLKYILIQSKIFVDDKSKNFVCICPYCNDHPDPRKKGHLYVSKNVKIPIAHCFFCNEAVSIKKLIEDLTGDKEISKQVITEEEHKKYQVEDRQFSTKTRFRKLKLPEIIPESFINKRVYLKKRTNNKIDIDLIPNVVFNFLEFFKINNLDIVGKDKTLSDFEVDILQTHFVGFLSENNTTLFCRTTDESSKFKFRKIPLQNESLLLLDYYSIVHKNPNNEIVVLSEGIFDILGEYITDSLGIKNKVKVYASGNSFSYSSLLKSVCFNNDMFKVDVIILSDSDKKLYTYNKFLKKNAHIIRTCQIYINRAGKDFGVFPQKPVKIS